MSRPRLIAAGLFALAVALFFIIQTVRWSGKAGAERAHERFLTYIEDKRWSKCYAMLSESYADQWDFSRDEISLVMQDLGSVYTFWLEIDWSPVAGAGAVEPDGAIPLTGTARFEGQGGPFANVVSSRLNGYAGEPFTFRWRREGLLPWKWKLQSISHPSASVPADYTPGQLGYQF